MSQSTKTVKDNLIMLDSRRIVLPTPAIKPILTRLHIGHAGQEKTLALANQIYFWQGMANDIKTMVDNCDQCQERRPSQQHNPRTTEPPSANPLQTYAAQSEQEAPEPGRQSSLKNNKTANVKPKRDKNKFRKIFYMHSF